MKKKKEPVEHKKWERRFEDDDHISIWRYDSKKSTVNPYEVEIIYKNDKPSKGRKKGTSK